MRQSDSPWQIPELITIPCRYEHGVWIVRVRRFRFEVHREEFALS
jgi:hypothetical protein